MSLLAEGPQVVGRCSQGGPEGVILEVLGRKEEIHGLYPRV